MRKVIRFPNARRLIEINEQSGRISDKETFLAWIHAMKAQLKGKNPNWHPTIEIKIKR
ncbi:hypothetical protein [Tepidanaerobacter acetatoxydans]|uniref:hypothetical protein n=1 Tax=Tepidanaerobacter acetatoxydans TaxID=499229 RepID=UPI001BD503C3|nr:hypothetical protein [Tepidanaerobacter acetatoxydans]